MPSFILQESNYIFIFNNTHINGLKLN